MLSSEGAMLMGALTQLMTKSTRKHGITDGWITDGD